MQAPKGRLFRSPHKPTPAQLLFRYSTGLQHALSLCQHFTQQKKKRKEPRPQPSLERDKRQVLDKALSNARITVPCQL